eukprot:Nk52_evm12s328 gene=Nk52_evmTU12s328
MSSETANVPVQEQQKGEALGDEESLVDPKYELDAPMYVDFTSVALHNRDSNADEWFEYVEDFREGGMPADSETLDEEKAEGQVEEKEKPEVIVIDDDDEPEPKEKATGQKKGLVAGAEVKAAKNLVTSFGSLKVSESNSCSNSKMTSNLNKQAERVKKAANSTKPKVSSNLSKKPTTVHKPVAQKKTFAVEKDEGEKFKSFKVPAVALKTTLSHQNKVGHMGLTTPSRSGTAKAAAKHGLMSAPSRSQAPASVKKVASVRKPASASVSKLKANPPSLTVPRTPEFLHRNNRSLRSKPLSTEERELQEIKKAREEMAKRRLKANQAMKKAAVGAITVSARSLKPLTNPQGFNFHSTSRPRLQSTSSNESSQEKRSSKPHTNVKPIRGNEHFMQPTKASSLVKNREVGNGDKRGPYVPLASKLKAFDKTPDRYRRAPTPGKSQASSSFSSNGSSRNSQPMALTQPKTPKLISGTRLRPIVIKSKEELEEEEMKKIPKFKAKELNPRIFESRGDYGVPRIKKKTLTEAKGMQFRTEERIKHRHEHEDEVPKPKDSHIIKANPVPQSLFTSISGPPQRKGAVHESHLTVPQSPKLMTATRAHAAHHTDSVNEVENTHFEAHPAPSFKNVFKPTLKHKHTHPSPFKVAEKCAERLKISQSETEEALRLEQENKQFRANLMPSPSVKGVPQKKHIPTTNPTPFHLKTDERGKYLQEKFYNTVVMEDMEQNSQFDSFQAQPIPESVYAAPFVPHRSTKKLTEAQEIRLHTEEREAHWKAHSEEQRKAEEDARKQERERIHALKAQEEEEVKMYRQQLVHKPNPIRRYKAVDCVVNDTPLTEPYSPQLSTKLRASTRGV